MRNASVNWNRLLLLLLFLGVVFVVYDFLNLPNSRTVRPQTNSRPTPTTTLPPQTPFQTPNVTSLPTPIPTRNSIIPRGEGEGGFDN